MATPATPVDRDKVCPTCHRLLPTSAAAHIAPALLPPFEHQRARSGSISARRGSVGAASKTEWQRLRSRLIPAAESRRNSILRPQLEDDEHKEDAPSDYLQMRSPDKTHFGDSRMSEEEMKETILKLLAELENMSTRHDALVANQLDLENSLKIARSNLTLAEANSEMLEEALRRGGDGFAGRMAPPPRSGAGTPQPTDTNVGLMMAPPGMKRATTAAPPAAAASVALKAPVAVAAPVSSLELMAPAAATMPPSVAPKDSAAAAVPAPSGAPKESAAAAVPTASGAPKESAAAAVPTASSATKASAAPAPAAASSSAAVAAKPVSPTSPSHERPVLARRRSGSEGVQKLAPARPAIERSNTFSDSAGISGFFRRSMEKRPQMQINLSNLATNISDTLLSPSSTSRSEFFSQLGMGLEPASTSSPNVSTSAIMSTSPPNKASPLRPSTESPRPAGPTSTAPTPVSQSYEIYRLRQSLAATQTKVAALSEELTSAKKGKAAVEAELEALSQELFEEANRMVSEERKLRATIEAEAAELKEERDALKRTMTLMEREVQAVSAKVSGEFSQGEAINGSVPVSDGAPIVSEEGWGDIPPVKSTTTPPPPPTEAEIEELMKRMEADFGKL